MNCLFCNCSWVFAIDKYYILNCANRPVIIGRIASSPVLLAIEVYLPWKSWTFVLLHLLLDLPGAGALPHDYVLLGALFLLLHHHPLGLQGLLFLLAFGIRVYHSRIVGLVLAWVAHLVRASLLRLLRCCRQLSIDRIESLVYHVNSWPTWRVRCVLWCQHFWAIDESRGCSRKVVGFDAGWQRLLIKGNGLLGQWIVFLSAYASPEEKSSFVELRVD